MPRRLAGLLAAFVLGTVLGGITGVFIFIRSVGGSGEASAPISAPTLSLAMLTTTLPAPQVDQVAMATQVAVIAASLQQLERAQQGRRFDALSTQVAAVSQRIDQTVVRQAVPATVTRPPTLTPQPALTLTPTAAPLSALDGQRLYRIVPEESEARFILDEIEPLRNNLVGSTDQIAGDFIIDFDHPANSRIGVIRVNMRTFRTDSRDRDRVIRGEIFQSDHPQYEFSDFTPQIVTGLPEAIEADQTVTFQVTGDFPIRGITHAFTFDVTVTLVSADEVRGVAHTVINRSDYGLLQSFLADHGVSEEITLELEFVARAVES